MGKHLQGLALVQASALQQLEQVEAKDPGPGDSANRTAEFLLLVRRLERHVSWPVGRLLELGCGRGFTLRLWGEVADSVTGVDIGPAIAACHKFFEAFPPPRSNIEAIESTGEQFCSAKKYDLIVSQYVLEHVNDEKAVFARVHDNLAAGGLAVHVLNNTVSRTSWFVEYRQTVSVARRLFHGIRAQGLMDTLLHPLAFTVPHEPRFGSFAYELEQYRLDRWAMKLMLAEFEVIDWFQTADFNYVFVTRPLGATSDGRGKPSE